MTIKSCDTCPSRLAQDHPEIKKRFKKQMNSPMCGRFGHLLSRPGIATEDQIGLYWASTCGSYGDVLPPVPVSVSHVVIKGSASALAGDGSEPDTLTSCSNCVNFMSPSVGMSKLGWPSGACLAKGTLVPMPMSAARDCSYARSGAPCADEMDPRVRSIELLPLYEAGFRLSVADAAKAYGAMTGAGSGAGDFDPETYPTDAPVDASDAHRVRAWKKIINPYNGEEFYLPTFRRDFFSAEDQARIPTTGDAQHPEDYIDHANILLEFVVGAYEMNEILMLEGEPGSGKTEFGRFVAWLMGLPLTILSITSETDVNDFLGWTDLKDGNTVFTPGRLPNAWIKPGFLVSDEVNIGPSAIVETYRSLATGADDLWIANNCFKRDDYLFPIMTSNPAWDFRNLGTKPLADADIDRYSPVEVPMPPSHLVQVIIARAIERDGRTLSDEKMAQIMKINDDLREMGNQGNLPFRWGLRKTIRAARFACHFDLSKAFRRAALDFASPEEREVALAAINSIIGS